MQQQQQQQQHKAHGASMLQEINAAVLATSKGPAAAVAKLRAPNAATRRKGLLAVVQAVGCAPSLAVSALPPDQQSAWASQATTVVEAVVRLVADGLGGPTHAEETRAAQSERRNETSGASEGPGDGVDAELVVGWEQEGWSALLPGAATACGALMQAHPSAPQRFVAAMLSCVRRGKTEEVRAASVAHVHPGAV
jgi:hypothetical protein